MLTDPLFYAIYAALAIMAFGVYLIVRGLRGTDEIVPEEGYWIWGSAIDPIDTDKDTR